MFKLDEVWIDAQKRLFQRVKGGYAALQAGASGAYFLELDSTNMSFLSGGYSPATLTVSSRFQDNGKVAVAYAGRLVISYSLDGFSFTTSYTSSADEASHTFTPPTTGIAVIRFELYRSGATSTLLDTVDVNVYNELSETASATTVYLALSRYAVTYDRSGEFSPSQLTAYARYTDNTSYLGLFKFEYAHDIAGPWTTFSFSESAEIMRSAQLTQGSYFRVRLYDPTTGSLLRQVGLVATSVDYLVGAYLGSLSADPTSGYFINDYYFLDTTAALGGGVIRVATADGWATMLETNPLWAQAWGDAYIDAGAWATEQGEVVAAASAIFAKLVTADAFIANLFAQSITVPTGGKIRYFNGQGVQKRCVQLAEDRVDWFDTPDTDPASNEVLRARIGRLGVGGAVLMDGDFEANITSPWSDETVINAASSGTLSVVELTNGSVVVSYVRNSDSYLVERTYSAGAWGAESVINSAASAYPTSIQLADGSRTVAYSRSSDGFLVERLNTSGSWGAESVINAAGMLRPNYIQLDDGTRRIAYTRLDGYLVERIYSGAAWGAESVIDSSAAEPCYIQLNDSTLIVTYIRSSDSYLVERSYSAGVWGAESVINSAASAHPNSIQSLDGTRRVAYRRASDGYLVERVYSAGVWGAESVINSALSFEPRYIQLTDGSLAVVYLRDSTYYLVERTLRFYAQVGAGIIEEGSNAAGTETWEISGNSKLECDIITSPSTIGGTSGHPLAYAGVYTWTFPKAFKTGSSPLIDLSVSYSTTGLDFCPGFYYALSATSVSVVIYQSSNTVSPTIHIHAKGKVA